MENDIDFLYTDCEKASHHEACNTVYYTLYCIELVCSLKWGHSSVKAGWERMSAA